jgi:hypothetical protein
MLLSSSKITWDKKNRDLLFGKIINRYDSANRSILSRT